MTIEIKVPVLPESVTDATVATWHKKVGERVEQDENLVDIETDKVVLEVPVAKKGIIEKILKEAGSTVTAGEVIALFKSMEEGASLEESPKEIPAAAVPEAAVKEASVPTAVAGPAARRAMNEKGVSANEMKGTGKGGRITVQDVKQSSVANLSSSLTISGDRIEKRVPMTRLRARIAERLLSAQQNSAILTTFNEINMHPVMELRSRYKDQFEKAHGVKLGFMSFFTKAVTEALKRFPGVNASIDGNDVVYHGYFDIGVAVSTERGLVVPIIRDADTLSMVEIEKAIYDLGIKARDNKLAMEDITGGTFTISNGGIFGSLLSTPILNPPQAGILGMHKIEERAVVENKQVVVRPMMYVAFSYDHRLIDGKDSVRFLVTIKELIEDPARLLLNI